MNIELATLVGHPEVSWPLSKHPYHMIIRCTTLTMLPHLDNMTSAIPQRR